MKKTKENYNPLKLIGYGIQLILGYFAYKIFKGLHRKEKEYPIRHVRKETTYPDEWLDESEFYNHISKLSRERKNSMN